MLPEVGKGRNSEFYFVHITFDMSLGHIQGFSIKKNII